MTHEKKGKEKPGNAQHLETPKIDMPLDFMKIKFSELIHDDKEHYFMDQTKLAEVECSTCKLIFDYTQICPHQDIKSKEHKDSWQTLRNEIQRQSEAKNIEQKMQALKNVMNSLDSMSTVKQTAHTIVRGQF